MKKMKVKIVIGFFSPQDDNSIFNYLASCWTRSALTNGRTYSHVEMRFSDRATTSVTQNPGIVHYEKGRLLSNSGYRCFYEIEVDTELEKLIQEYAQKCAERRVPFNSVAVYWNFLPILSCFPIRAEDNAYFCSEYITTLLHKIGFCSELVAATTSPNDLYLALKNNPYAEPTFNKTLFKARNTKLLVD